jgi:hypothetical protein
MFASPFALPRPSPFAYPGGAPGFDPSHPASQNIIYSGVPLGGSIANPYSGQIGAASDAFCYGTVGKIGPAIGAGNAGGNTTGFNVSLLSNSPSHGTMAAIFEIDKYGYTFGNYQAFNVSTNTSWSVDIGTGGGSTQTFLLGSPFANNLFGSVSGKPTPGHSYFMAGSWVNGTTGNGALVDLTTGQTQFVLNQSFAGPSGGWTLTGPQCGRGTDNINSNKYLTGAVMYSGAYLSIAQLLDWAADPWSFWYPNQAFNIFGRAPGGGTTALFGRGQGASLGRASPSGRATMLGWSKSMSKGKVAQTVTAKLAVRSLSASELRAIVGAAAALKAKGAAGSSGRSFSTASAALLGRSGAQAKLRGTLAGRLSLFAHSVAASFSRIVPPGAIALFARSVAMAKATATAAGRLGLAGRLSSASFGRVLPPAAVALLARSFAMARAAARSAGTTALRARSQASSFGRMVPPGAIALIARSFAAARSGAVAIGVAAMLARSGAASKGTLTLSGFVSLSGTSKAISFARETLTATLYLQLSGARSMAVSSARSALPNLLTIAGKFAREFFGSATLASFAGKQNQFSITGSAMTIVHDTQTFYCGETWEILGTLTDTNDAPIDLTGASVEWKLDDPSGTTNIKTSTMGAGISLSGQPAAGQILIIVSATDTDNFAPGEYRDQLTLTLADGTVSVQWVGTIMANIKL